MTYNIYIAKVDGKYNIFGLSDNQLSKLIQAYKFGEDSVTLSGTTYYLKGLSSFQIFTNRDDNKDPSQYFDDLKRAGVAAKSFSGYYMTPNQLKYLGSNVTEKLIGDIGFGEEKQSVVEKVINEVQSKSYIDLTRIKELKQVASDYDLNKLIRLCEELNDNYSRDNFYSVGMLVRAIIDHVPPIFGLSNFKEVANNYGEGGKSFNKNMKHLENSLRNISDSLLHSQIRKKESLPNDIQVNFSQDLDVLLAEIIRIS
tara:strand:- start:1738 stop:2505 length:768 start_codon:yes stop_codon:yes gene_type:complete